MPGGLGDRVLVALLLQRLEHVPAAAGQLVGGQPRGVARDGRERRVVRREDDGRLGEVALRELGQEGDVGLLVLRIGRERRGARGASGSRARRGRWSTAITGAPAAASERMASRPLTKLTSSTTAGGSSERARRRPSASRRGALIAARAPAPPRRRRTGARPRRTPARARARGRAPAPARRSRACARARGERQRQRALHVQRAGRVVDLHREAAGARLGVGDRRPRARRRWTTSATVGARAVAHERHRLLGAVARHVARPEDRRVRARRERARVEAQVQDAGHLRSGDAVDRDARGLDRAGIVDVDVEARRVADRLAGRRRRRDPRRRVEVEPDAARARDLVRARAGRCRARSPISSRAIVSGSLGWPAARSRCMSSAAAPGGVRRRGRGADHRDARPDGGRRRRDDVGLQAAVLGRALGRVVGRRRRPASRARRP